MTSANASRHRSSRPAQIWALPAIALALQLNLLPEVHASPSKQKPLPSAEAILRGSIDSARKLNIRATETVMVNPLGQDAIRMTREVIRTKSGITLTRWLHPADQRGLVILDDGEWTRSFQPTDGYMRVSRSTPRAHDARSANRLARLILRNYRVSLKGKEPMAARMCYRLMLTPVHDISHTMEMWIDCENSALLSHTETITKTGGTVSLAFFQGVAFPKSQKESDLRNALPAHVKQMTFSKSKKVFTNFSEVRKSVDFDFCPPYSMPGGYEFERAEVISLKGVTTTCLRYTDGIGEITICQNRAREQRPAGYRATRRMMDPMGNAVVDFQTERMNYYLVGRCEINGLVAVTDALDAQKEHSYLDFFVRTYHIPMATLAGLRNQGMGLDTLDALLAISRQANMPLDPLIGLCKDGHDWAAIARKFRANVSGILAHVRRFQCP